MARVTVERTDHGTEPHVLGYGGKDWNLPPSLPVAALEALMSPGTGEQLLAFFQAMLGPQTNAKGKVVVPDQWPRFVKVLNIADLEDLAGAIASLYGSSLGESEASGSSSESVTAS